MSEDGEGCEGAGRCRPPARGTRPGSRMGRIVSLRTHSWYSLLEGVSSPVALLERAAEAGYQAVALTDCNSLAGAVEFAAAAQQVGVRAILGAHVRLQNQRATLLIAEPA